MPVILPWGKEDIWINPAFEDKNQLLTVLKPYPSEDMEVYEVSTTVNSPQYNSPSNIKPI
jgi:putative SOS response-associated peptidase YedK